MKVPQFHAQGEIHCQKTKPKRNLLPRCHVFSRHASGVLCFQASAPLPCGSFLYMSLGIFRGPILCEEHLANVYRDRISWMFACLEAKTCPTQSSALRNLPRGREANSRLKEPGHISTVPACTAYSCAFQRMACETLVTERTGSQHPLHSDQMLMSMKQAAHLDHVQDLSNKKTINKNYLLC